MIEIVGWFYCRVCQLALFFIQVLLNLAQGDTKGSHHVNQTCDVLWHVNSGASFHKAIELDAELSDQLAYIRKFRFLKSSYVVALLIGVNVPDLERVSSDETAVENRFLHELHDGVLDVFLEV